MKQSNSELGNKPAAAAQNFGIRRRVLAATVLATGLVVGCGGWAAQAKLSGAIVAHGKLAVKKQVKLIQHRDGGIVEEILVANGDAVKAGDILIRLDETQIRADLGVMRLQLAQYKGRLARLRAERDGADSIAFDEGFELLPEAVAIASGERSLFSDNRSIQEAQREQLISQVQQYEEQVRGLEAQQASNEVERQLVSEDLERLTPLAEKRLIEGTTVRNMRRDLNRIDGLKGEIESSIARARGQISEARLKIIELDQQVRTDAQRELTEIEANIAALSERIVAAQDKLSRMDMRAPIPGFVNDLAVHTVNGVIAPGETVMSIVPEGEELVVEARLSPVDIDQVSAGQSVRLRFSAFNQRTTPEIGGVVDVIGAASTVDKATGETFYLSSIAIADQQRALDDKPLLPGMPVEVFITTTERSALSYLVKPFADQVMRSFRED
jgi:HlyD family secretion protein